VAVAVEAGISDEEMSRRIAFQDTMKGRRLSHQVADRHGGRIGLEIIVLEYLGIVMVYLLA
jgi:hypothetical protein